MLEGRFIELLEYSGFIVSAHEEPLLDNVVVMTYANGELQYVGGFTLT